MRHTIHLACAGLFAFCNCVVAEDKPVTAGTNDIYVIPYSHLDLMWGGTLEECLSRGGRITDKAIQIAQRHSEFQFMLEDDVFVASYMETHRGTPELETFKQMVKEGRIELAPTWAGIYMNLPRGEALVRNCIYGKEYAHDVFGVNPQTAVFTDIPGFTEQLPQIFSKSDIPFMVMTRMGPPTCSLFRYRSPDGSSELTYSAADRLASSAAGSGSGPVAMAERNVPITGMASASPNIRAQRRGCSMTRATANRASARKP